MKDQLKKYYAAQSQFKQAQANLWQALGVTEGAEVVEDLSEHHWYAQFNESKELSLIAIRNSDGSLAVYDADDYDCRFGMHQESATFYLADSDTLLVLSRENQHFKLDTFITKEEIKTWLKATQLQKQPIAAVALPEVAFAEPSPASSSLIFSQYEQY